MAGQSTQNLRAGMRMRYPDQSPACEFGRGPVEELGEVVQSRHRAEAAEWAALFTLYRREADRLSDVVLQRTAEYAKVDAAEAACARWCVAAPVTVAATRYRLKAAIQLFEYLPLLARAFLDGQLPASLVQQIVSRTYDVNPDLCGAVDAGIDELVTSELNSGVRLSARAVTTAVDEIVMLIDPEGVRTVARAARRGIGLSMDSLPGGVARLVAVLPGPAAAMIHARVDALARRIHAGRPVDETGTRLTLSRCRAIALLVVVAGRAGLAAAGEGPDLGGMVDEALVAERAEGEGRKSDHRKGAGCACGDPAPGATVMIHTTQEAVDNPSGIVPVWIDRLGLLPSAAVAGLLRFARRTIPRAGPDDQLRPGDWLSWLTTPRTPLAATQWEEIASAVPPYALRYRIPDWLKAKVRMRDGCCRFPGCSVPAEDCDVDHIRPFQLGDPISGGWTIEANLGAMCRTHHRLKTHDSWTVTVDEHAVFTFTSPDGAAARTCPSGPASRVGLAEDMLGGEDLDPSAAA